MTFLPPEPAYLNKLSSTLPLRQAGRLPWTTVHTIHHFPIRRSNCIAPPTRRSHGAFCPLRPGCNSVRARLDIEAIGEAPGAADSRYP